MWKAVCLSGSTRGLPPCFTYKHVSTHRVTYLLFNFLPLTQARVKIYSVFSNPPIILSPSLPPSVTHTRTHSRLISSLVTRSGNESLSAITSCHFYHNLLLIHRSATTFKPPRDWRICDPLNNGSETSKSWLSSTRSTGSCGVNSPWIGLIQVHS